jgi:hypothetical protein
VSLRFKCGEYHVACRLATAAAALCAFFFFASFAARLCVTRLRSRAFLSACQLSASAACCGMLRSSVSDSPYLQGGGGGSGYHRLQYDGGGGLTQQSVIA